MSDKAEKRKKRTTKTLPQEIAEAVDRLEEYTGVNLKRATARTIKQAYRATVLATPALTLPLVIGSVPAVSQERGAREPEEHQGSQSQEANTIRHRAEYYVSSSGESLNNFAVIKDGSKLYFTIPSKPPTKTKR
jgi:hypothetical protein